MPRLFKRPPKYRYHKSTNQAVVEYAGERHYLGPHGSEASHVRYREHLARWQALRQQQAADQPVFEAIAASITEQSLREKRKLSVPVTIDELIIVYRRHAYQYYRKRGEVTREAEQIAEVGILLSKDHGRTPIESFGPVALDAFRDDLITEHDWSRKYINKQIARVVAMFRWAAMKEICSPGIHSALDKLTGLKKGRTEARETEPVRSVADEIVDATLPRLPEIVADMVRFHRLTGARPGEVCSLRPGDIDRSGEVWVYRPDAHKTEHYLKDRLVLIGPAAQELLLPYLGRPDESYCFSPAESVERSRRRAEAIRKTPLSCGNRRGDNRVANPQREPSARYKTASYRLAVRRACEKAGVSVWTPNQLRHTTATHIRKRFGLEAAQIICGHEKADVTQVYAERDLELGKRVMREVG